MGLIKVEINAKHKAFNDFTVTLARLGVKLVPNDKGVDLNRVFQLVSEIGTFIDKWGSK